jgi:hypothetical protein
MGIHGRVRNLQSLPISLERERRIGTEERRYNPEGFSVDGKDHPAQESLRDTVRAFPEIFCLTPDAGGGGWVRDRLPLRQWGRPAGTGRVRDLARSLDCL